MSNTVYSLVQEYAKTVPHFKFHSAGINLIGQFVAREWRRQGGTMDQLNKVQSTESNEIFTVYEYPAAFIPTIHEIIGRYVKWCLTPNHPKVKNEKPLIKSNPARPISYSSDPASPKKTRKRIPIKSNKGTP